MEPPGRGGAKQQGGLLSSGGGVLRVILGVLRVILGVLRERTGSAKLGAPPPETENSVKKTVT